MSSPAKSVSFKPILVPGNQWSDYLLTHKSSISVVDQLDAQLIEFFKTTTPPAARKYDFEERLEAFVKSKTANFQYNVVVYPWLNKAVFILEEDAFVTVRTSRNQYKITKAEQELLHSKAVGVVGLSVGQSVAITMAMERSFGRIKLADFDDLDLSNLNRLRASVADIGIPKTVLVAREMAEIDPYLNVELFTDGLTADNLEEFIDDLDVLIDECDSLSMKIAMRFYARKKSIPVVMDTSDRGMIDVERFDCEPKRLIFHGLVPEYELKDLYDKNRLSILFRLVGGVAISPELALSFFELNQTISTWPQLASAVSLGGGLGASVVRQILLGKHVASGRWFFDAEQSWHSPVEVHQQEEIISEQKIIIDEMILALGIDVSIKESDAELNVAFKQSLHADAKAFYIDLFQSLYAELNGEQLELMNVFNDVVLLKKNVHEIQGVGVGQNMQDLRIEDTTNDESTKRLFHHQLTSCVAFTESYQRELNLAICCSPRSLWAEFPIPFVRLLSRQDVSQQLNRLNQQNTISGLLFKIISKRRFLRFRDHDNLTYETLLLALVRYLSANKKARLVWGDESIFSNEVRGEKKIDFEKRALLSVQILDESL